MATRATYGFHASGKPDITIYIHHDGYEAGAGSYIAKAFAEGGETLNDYFTVPRTRTTASSPSTAP